MPAGVAADLVVVQAALLLRGLEAFFDGPAGTGDVDHLIKGGVRGAVGDVVGDFLGPADAAAGDRPVPTVVSVPGSDLHSGPVEDAGPLDHVGYQDFRLALGRAYDALVHLHRVRAADKL